MLQEQWWELSLHAQFTCFTSTKIAHTLTPQEVVLRSSGGNCQCMLSLLALLVQNRTHTDTSGGGTQEQWWEFVLKDELGEKGTQVLGLLALLVPKY